MLLAALRTAPATHLLRAVGLPSVVALAVVYLWGVRTRAGQSVDERLFGWFVSLGPTAHHAAPFLRSGIPVLLAGAVAMLGLLAAAGRRWRALSGSVLLVALSVLASRTLRDHVFTRPALGVPGYPDNTLPSSHVTLTVALCVALVTLWPHTRAAASATVQVAAGAAAALGAAASVVSWAHRPFDVVASALLVAVTGTAVACVVRVGSPVRRRST